ncbi:MAG: universal stress protein [Chitinophagaceae bacterium]
MPKRFGTILIPVDFSVNTDIAISKALGLTESGNCSIHLFHVQRIILPNFLQQLQYYITGFSRHDVNVCINKAAEKLSKLKSVIEDVRKDIDVFTWVTFGGPVEEAIAKKAKRLGADLILLGKHSHHSTLPFLNTVVPSRLAAISGVPVLTAKPGSLHTEIKTVVIPVGVHFPGNKLDVLEALEKNASLKIRLVVFSGDKNDSSLSKQSLLNTFQTLKSKSANQVNYEILTGSNRAKALLVYCGQVGADVLIVNPGSETRVSVWINSHISDLLPADSRTQVLAVTPG